MAGASRYLRQKYQDSLGFWFIGWMFFCGMFLSFLFWFHGHFQVQIGVFCVEGEPDAKEATGFAVQPNRTFQFQFF